MTDAINDVLADDAAATLNRVLMEAPSLITDAMYDVVIERLRKDRTLFMQKEAGGKKDGEPTTSEATDTPQD